MIQKPVYICIILVFNVNMIRTDIEKLKVRLEIPGIEKINEEIKSKNDFFYKWQHEELLQRNA